MSKRAEDAVAIGRKGQLKSYFGKTFGRSGSAIVALILLLVIMSIVSEQFLTLSNFFNVFRQATVNAIVACGITFVIITGGIDLSVGPNLAFLGCLSAGFIVNNGMPVWLAFVLVLIIGCAIGFLKGFIISTQKLPAFIVTLAFTQILNGAAYLYTNGRPIPSTSEAYKFLGRGYVASIPFPIIVALLILVITWFLLNKTTFGRHVFAVGGNQEASRLCGVNINWTLIKTYLFSGLLIALAALTLASRLASGTPASGDGAELDAIAAVVLGGTALDGGRGNIMGTLVGVLLMAFLNNGLNLLSVNAYIQLIIKGVVILLAVWINSVRGMKKA